MLYRGKVREILFAYAPQHQETVTINALQMKGCPSQQLLLDAYCALIGSVHDALKATAHV